MESRLAARKKPVIIGRMRTPSNPSFTWSLTFLVLLALAGCGPSTSVKTDGLRAAYQGAPSETKTLVDKAISELSAKRFPEGMRALRDAARAAKPTEEQAAALTDMITQVQIILSQNPRFDVAATYEAIAELDAILTGRPPMLMPGRFPPGGPP